MIIQNPQPPQPILKVSEKNLDFGLVNFNMEPSENRGIAKLTITNEGERLLVGRIAIQVAWASTFPPDFRLNPGESSDHYFTIRRSNPISWNSGHKLGSDFIALINSNGGSETIGGYYFIDNTEIIKKKQSPVSPKIFLILLVFLLLTAGVLFFIFHQDKEIIQTKGTESVSAIYTQLAETIFAELDVNAGTPTAMYDVFAAAPTLDPNQDAAPSAEATYTPWPVAEYPNPETFVHNYFSAVASKNFTSAWWMLAERVQINCCYNKGINPADYYAASWNDVTDIEVNYAYLQNPNENPAIMNTSVTYTHEDGTKSQHNFAIEVITSTTQGELLIQDIK